MLQAIRLLQQGDPTQADGLLSMLGFRHRLATAAFQLPVRPSAVAAAPALQAHDAQQQQQLGVQDEGSQGEQCHWKGQGRQRHLSETPAPGLSLPQASGLKSDSPHPDQLPLQSNTATAPAHVVLATGAAATARPPAPPPLVLEAALDPALLAVLQRGFSPTAAYWREHGYWGGSSGFFSYVYPFSDRPRHPIEAAIVQLHQRLLGLAAGGHQEEEAGPAGPLGAAGAAAQAELGGSAAEAAELAARVQRATHAEWWVHCRASSAPHQLHFDVGEAAATRILPWLTPWLPQGHGSGTLECRCKSKCISLLVAWSAPQPHSSRSNSQPLPTSLRPASLLRPADETRLRRGRGGYSLRHPLLGSLLFLSGHPSHGPTFVLDQSPCDPGLAAGGWLVGAATGRYAAFRGDLLHGVMPGGWCAAWFSKRGLLHGVVPGGWCAAWF